MLNRKRLRELEAKIGSLDTTGGVTVPAGSIDTTELADGVLAASVAGRVLMATDVFDEATVDAKFASGAIDADRIKSASLTATQMTTDFLLGTQAAEVADANVIGGLMVVHRILLASGANADVDVLLTEKTRIMDAIVILKGAGTTGSIVTVKNVTTAISDAIDVASGADKAVFHPGTMDDDQQEIAAAANLRISYASTSADFPGAEVYVIGMKVA